MMNGRTTAVIAAVLTAFLASACTGAPSLNKLTGNIFKEKEEILPGERVAVLKSESELKPDSDAAKLNISLPAENANAEWTQPGGDPNNAPGNLAFSGSLKERWVADAGKGTSSDGQLIPRPIVYGGRIFTLDTRGVVRSFSSQGGSVSWSTSLTPESEEKSEGYGGGLAADNGRLFATTGYGTIVALNPANGKIEWTKSIGVPMRTSPTAVGGKVFAVTTEGRLYCLSAADGEEIWIQRGLPDDTSILSNNSPAVSGKVVVVPYSSGEISAYDTATGQQVWGDSLASARTNSIISAVTYPGRPAIYNGVVYAVGNSGRMIANKEATGERLWSMTLSSTQTPWPAGNMVYVVDSAARVVAMTRDKGTIVWVQQLTEGQQWTGPVLAGGKLWVASAKGLVAGLDPRTGKVVNQRDIGYSIRIAPVVAAGHMYILADNAKLIALN